MPRRSRYIIIKVMKTHLYNDKRVFFNLIAIFSILIWLNVSYVSADSGTVEYQGEDIWEEEGAATEIQYTGGVELTSYISTDPDQDPEDALKKNELKGRFTLKYGSDTAFFYTASYAALCFPLTDEHAPDFYSYSEDDIQTSRNLRISASEWEIAANELYVNYTTDIARFRIGNQIFDWGVTNIISPTTYFNPGDFRELMFNMIQEDAMTGVPSLTWLGTPAVSLMVFPFDYTCEVVVAPVHTPMLLPLNDGFWSVEMDSNLYSVYFEETDDLEISGENTGVGVRVSGTFMDADVSLSAFHGPDKEAVLIPSSIGLAANEAVSVHVVPTYYTVNKVGMDVSYSHEGLGVQFSAVYSPDMSVLPQVSIDLITDTDLPLKVLTTPFVQYAVSVNYLVPLYKLLKHHKGMSVLFLEYSRMEYFDEEAAGSLFPTLLALGYMDSFFDDRLRTAFMALIDRNSGSNVIRPQIGYKIRNNITVQVSYTCITGKSLEDGSLIESAFYYFRNNDVAMCKIAYTF